MTETTEQKNPETEAISLNPEILEAQLKAQSEEVVQAAIDFMRRQGAAKSMIIAPLEYKALREATDGWRAVAYEYRITQLLTRLDVAAEAQQSAPDPSPESEAPQEETLPVDTSQVQSESELPVLQEITSPTQ